jgi:hypothetical protein
MKIDAEKDCEDCVHRLEREVADIRCYHPTSNYVSGKTECANKKRIEVEK